MKWTAGKTSNNCAQGVADLFGVVVEPLAAVPDLELRWQALENQAAPSFFQSWHWIGFWLEQVRTRRDLQVMSIRRGARLVGLGVLGITGRHLPWLARAYLNETGTRALDRFWPEYNGFLLARGSEDESLAALLCQLYRQERSWHGVYLSGVEERYVAAARNSGYRVVTRLRVPTHHVDLAAVRRSGGDFLGLLSKNTRRQIRRSLRLYEAQGALRLREAETSDEAQAFLGEMVRLHQARWVAKGKPGNYANGFFGRFQKGLVAHLLPRQGVQLLRVSAGDMAVGYLYNFVHEGRVYTYQTGLNYEVPDKRMQPGLVCDALAIQHNAARGLAVYDMMEGHALNKQRLRTGGSELYWLTLHRTPMHTMLHRQFLAAKDVARKALR